jgi:hypothetical protein
MALSKNAETLLVRYLARTESPWRPIRHAWQEGSAIQAARQRGLRGDGGDGRSRKAEERSRHELAAAGYTRAETLTTEGKQIARQWTWTFVASELYAAIGRIVDRVKAGDCRSGGWVPETLILGCPYTDDMNPIADLQALLVPALADGVVESSSDTQGHAFYRLAVEWPTGRDRLAVSEHAEPIRNELHGVYMREYQATWQAILKDKRRYHDIAPIPAPASLELISKRHPDDVSNITPLFNACE